MTIPPLLTLLAGAALGGTLSGRVLDFQDRPVAGARVVVGSDTALSGEDGSFQVERSTGLARRTQGVDVEAFGPRIGMEGGALRLGLGSRDPLGRGRGGRIVRAPEASGMSRALAADDTLRIFWNWKALLKLPLRQTEGSVPAFRVDTLWQANPRFVWNPVARPGSVASSDGKVHLRTVTLGVRSWTVDFAVVNYNVGWIDSSISRLCPEGWRFPDGRDWDALIDSLNPSWKVADTLEALGLGVYGAAISGMPYSDSRNGGQMVVDVIEAYPDGDRSYDVWVSGRTKYGKADLRCVKEN